MASKPKGLIDRLKDGDNVIVAEGYLFEFERRGYLKAGAFVPEVVLEHPKLVRIMHEEFVHAGSDVVEAFTYYGHREKLRLIGREDDLESLNRKALGIAREVADRTGTLMAGNISNTNLYAPNDIWAEEKVFDIFKEQIEWAVEEGADYIIGETYSDLGEAMLALEAIKKYGKGLPAVITLTPTANGKGHDGTPLEEICQQLEEAGAACVGLNCSHGPISMLPLIRKVRTACKGPVACLPVPYRTSDATASYYNLKDPICGESSFPCDLDAWLCSHKLIQEFTQGMKELGVQYIGLCCGNRAHYIRTMAEKLGRRPPASRYSPDMSQHESKLTNKANAHAITSFNTNMMLK